MKVQTIKYLSITSNETKNRQSFAPSPPPPHSLLFFPLSFFFSNYYDIFCWISVLYRQEILALWPTAPGGLLPPWPTTLGHNAIAHDPMLLTSWATTLCFSHTKGPLLAAPIAVGHGVMSLTPWATVLCPWRRGSRRQMYSFAKFRTDHIFLQILDRKNIKKYSVIDDNAKEVEVS
jgi:hypothetical protein